MMKRTLAAALSASLALAGPLLAHGGYTHVMGTVTAVDANHVEVKTRAGKVVSVKLTESTKYTRGAAAAAAKDIVVGQRVSVEAKPKGEDLEASEVRLGVMTKAAPAK
jgi:urease accessory protein UreF